MILQNKKSNLHIKLAKFKGPKNAEEVTKKINWLSKYTSTKYPSRTAMPINLRFSIIRFVICWPYLYNLHATVVYRWDYRNSLGPKK